MGHTHNSSKGTQINIHPYFFPLGAGGAAQEMLDGMQPASGRLPTPACEWLFAEFEYLIQTSNLI